VSRADAEAGVTARADQAGPYARVTLERGESREVTWHVAFDCVREAEDEPLEITGL
jgi:hypothetical protein